MLWLDQLTLCDSVGRYRRLGSRTQFQRIGNKYTRKCEELYIDNVSPQPHISSEVFELFRSYFVFIKEEEIDIIP